MKKLLAMILIGMILSVSVSSGAEYEQFRLTEGDVGGTANIIPLDARNAVVIARPVWNNPWHVTWYRDGGKYLDMSGPTKDPVLVGMQIPYPALWDGGELTMLCNEWIGKTSVTDADTEAYLNPANYQAYLAKWTENGLERTEKLPESWYRSFHCGESILFREGRQWRILYDGKETILPDQMQISADASVTNCMPLGGDAFLLSVTGTSGASRQLICADSEKVRYQISLPASAYLQAADGQGGFFSADDWPSGDYSPLILAHYNAYGLKDRTLKLGGSNVVVQFFGTTADQDTGLCTLYGSAAANSRKVYTVFAMTLDTGLNVRSLDVRKIDPAYGEYSPAVYFAKDGTAWVFISDRKERGLRPVLIPFPFLEQSRNNYGLTLQ